MSSKTSECSNVGKRLSGVLFLMSKSSFLVKLIGKSLLKTGQTNKNRKSTNEQQPKQPCSAPSGRQIKANLISHVMTPLMLIFDKRSQSKCDISMKKLNIIYFVCLMISYSDPAVKQYYTLRKKVQKLSCAVPFKKSTFVSY